MTILLAFLWVIGALFTLGIFIGYRSAKPNWYFYLAAPVACAFCWPVLLGVIVGSFA